MTISNYLLAVVGESPQRAAKLHPASIARLKACAIAIHIPTIMWALTGYVISSAVFHLDAMHAVLVAAMCATLIYLVERLVIATPKTWFINIGRVLMGVIIAVLGASAFDLVIFDREVSQQLRGDAARAIESKFDQMAVEQGRVAQERRQEWLKAQADANCEANGTCGSKVRSVGPVYRELARQAATLKEQYVAAEARLQELRAEKEQELAALLASARPIEEAGLLARIEALHRYTMNNQAALVAWSLFFALVLLFELMVVLVKLVFGETVDDRIDVIREQISYQTVLDYADATTSPLRGARGLLVAAP